jgi:NAD(P)-dependent dehydrogenase (short-subunit alcohol dehydrogenase family)
MPSREDAAPSCRSASIARKAATLREAQMGRLQGKVALVTGAASGIGAATAQRFVEEGAQVAGIDVAEPPLDLLESLQARGNVRFYVGDVSDESSVCASVAAAIREFGRADILVNAAGVGSGGPSEEVAVAEWDRVMNINLRGSFLAAREILPRMLQQRCGSIVNIASIEGLEGLSGQLVYGTSKGGVVQMTRNLATDYAGRGIRVNCVCPGAIETPLTAVLDDPGLVHIKRQMESQHLMGRFGTATEVANAILFLASDEASFVTGHIMVVDGGYTAGRTYVM